MKKFRGLFEQHREKGRFRPVVPHNVANVPAAAPRQASDSSNVKLKEMTDTEEQSGGSIASETLKEKPNKEPMKKMKEEKDTREYDYEGDMVKSDLRSIMANAERIINMVEDNDNLPEWCQSKVTVAEDYISTVANYLTAEMKEEVQTKNKKDEPPFEGPYTKVPETTKDKSGAQHTAYSRVRHLARLGMKKQVKEEIVQEGRPSQRHPLEGHEYHKKSDEALIHIAKDAHAAAEAMKGHNTQAENKYRDQANDSATVRHYRKTHGMADWYKKKYGHMNESDAYDKDRYAVKDGKAVKDNPGHMGSPNYKDQPHHVWATSPEHALKLHTQKEEVEQIDEVSSEMLDRYKEKAKKSADELTAQGKHKEATNRWGNVMKATGKQIEKTTASIRKALNREEVEQLEEKNVPTSPEKWAQAKAQAKAKFDVYPSAYANGWAAKKYKEMGGGWKSVNEQVKNPDIKADKTNRPTTVSPNAPVVKESRKAQIVKELIKNKKDKLKSQKGQDKFDAEPVMTGEIMKA